MEIIIWTIATLLILSFGFVVAFGPPYVPSRLKHVREAFEDVCTLGKDDLLLDLGSGNGVVLRAAAMHGARAVGYELNPLLALLSNFLTRKYPKATTVTANFMRRPFPAETTVVYIFGDSRDIKKIEKRIRMEATRLKKPLRVLSYGFRLSDATLLTRNSAYYLYRIEPLHESRA